MEYYGNKLCVSYKELIDGGIMSVPNYKAMSSRGRFDVVRRGNRSSCALIAVDSLPESYREEVRRKYPDGAMVLLVGWVNSNYELDQGAVVYFHDDRAKDYRKLMGEKYDWSMMAEAIEVLRDELHHTLPKSTLRFRKKVNEYRKEGYGCLISGKFGNQSARKVDYKTERLILAIACLPNKPYNTSVLEMYNMFVTGELDVYDPETGELLNPDDFVDKTGEPKALSEATITNYLNKPKNRVLIEHRLTSFTTFMHEQMPHVGEL